MQKATYAIVGFVALLIVIGLALPRHARVHVETTIDAYPATVFALANDLRRYSIWAPRTETDPNARVVFSGPARGVGATMTWDGAIIGTGMQVITDSRPFEHIEMTVNPNESGEVRSSLDFAADGTATRVTWSFETDYGYNLAGRFLALYLTSVVREDYERGLERLRELAERLPRADFGDLEIEQIVVEATEIAYLPTTAAPEPAAISEAMGESYFEILSFIDRHGLIEAGAPISITRSFSGSRLLFDAAIPVRGVDESTPRDGTAVRIGRTYAGTVIRVRHVGPYRTLGETHRKIAAYMAALGLDKAGDAWESYVSDPTKVAEAELLTYIYYPIVP